MLQRLQQLGPFSLSPGVALSLQCQLHQTRHLFWRSGLLICLCAAVHHSQHSNGVLLPMHPRLPHHGDHHRHHQRWSLTSSATVHMSSRAANALSASAGLDCNAAVGIREGKEEERERVCVCVSVIIVVACGGGKIEPPVPVHCVKLW